jgi:endo-1,4-beta-xylanase
VPATFKGEGNADLYDVNLNPKPAYTQLQETLGLAAGAPHR